MKTTTTTKVNKADYEIMNFNGYYAIAEAGTFGGNVVWGGDSAWEDCYDEQLVQDIFEQWDGTLNEEGNIEVK